MNQRDCAPCLTLSRLVHTPEGLRYRYIDADEGRLLSELFEANFEVWCSVEGFLGVPHIYRELFQRTKVFTATVQDMVIATMHHTPSKWAEAARLIVDYSVIVLRSENSGFEKFLHSQRESIYWILDDALLRLCLDQWEVDEERHQWVKATQPIKSALLDAHEKLPGWGEMDYRAMLRFQAIAGVASEYFVASFFNQTERFLHESAKIAEILRTIRMSGIGRLPVELADIIIADVLSFEKLDPEDLRRAYLSKGKSTVNHNRHHPLSIR
jgi:hypothetical protein